MDHTCYVLIYLSVVAFRRRTNDEHRRLGDDYRRLTTPTAQKNFVKEFATRYSELSRLPYFNMVEQIVIDPMHNLFLGMPRPRNNSPLVLTPDRPRQDTLLRDLGSAEDPST